MRKESDKPETKDIDKPKEEFKEVFKTNILESKIDDSRPFSEINIRHDDNQLIEEAPIDTMLATKVA